MQNKQVTAGIVKRSRDDNLHGKYAHICGWTFFSVNKTIQEPARALDHLRLRWNWLWIENERQIDASENRFLSIIYLSVRFISLRTMQFGSFEWD